MTAQYEVLSPWAEVDPLPLRGISPRVSDLNGKRIGLFVSMFKRAAPLIAGVVEQRLKERFPSAQFSYFRDPANHSVIESDDKARFEDWVRELDAAVGAIGD
jgi:hypothetical protein